MQPLFWVKKSMQKIFLLVFLSTQCLAQNFSRISGPSGTVGNPALDDYWTGAAWVDVDNDGDLDLFLTNRIPGTAPRQNILYKNNASSFTKVTSNPIVNRVGYWFGTTWADFDNDGDQDCFTNGYPGMLMVNDGLGNFSRKTGGVIDDPYIIGTGCSWVDIDNDGFLDLLVIAPNWITPPPGVAQPGAPYLLLGNGPPNFNFTIFQDSTFLSEGPSTYLDPLFIDYDDDGDQDLFVGMGSGTSLPDFTLRNLLVETGNLGFERINDQILGLDSVEGNQWAFVDIDNDLDLDGYLANWAHLVQQQTIPRTNNLYRNQAGSFVKDTLDPIARIPSLTTTSLWGDYDNDADQDLILVSDSGFLLQYFQNDGDGNFQEIFIPNFSLLNLHQSGGSVGDYDVDGDLDVYIPGPGEHSAFFVNDVQNQNWVEFELRGSLSNRSGIGSKILIKANIQGQEKWQRRDVVGSGTFFGNNSLIQHFGLADATMIDSIIIKWPSGNEDVIINISSGKKYIVEEGGTILGLNQGIQPPVDDFQIFPNPVEEEINIRHLDTENHVFEICILDPRGNQLGPTRYASNINTQGLDPGVYFLRITRGHMVRTKKFIKQ